MKNMLRIKEGVSDDSKTKKEIISMVTELREKGLPKSVEGLLEMYQLYNRVFGQNKKPTNCIFCRKNIFESLEKAVMLLDIKPEQKTKSQRTQKPQSENSPKKRRPRTKKK